MDRLPERDWRAHWRAAPTVDGGTVDDTLRQVGKTVLGRPITHSQVDAILESITFQLDLEPTDVVIDLGCGNGLLTARIADRVSQVTGLDVSETLISTARALNSRPNCAYRIADLATLDSSGLPDATKAYSYEVLQHLSTSEVERLLGSLEQLFAAGLVLFTGSLPDRRCFATSTTRRSGGRTTSGIWLREPNRSAIGGTATSSLRSAPRSASIVGPWINPTRCTRATIGSTP